MTMTVYAHFLRQEKGIAANVIGDLSGAPGKHDAARLVSKWSQRNLAERLADAIPESQTARIFNDSSNMLDDARRGT